MRMPARRAAAALVLASVAAVLGAQDYTGNVRVQVRPDRDDWTYKAGDPARFRISVLRDGVPLAGARVAYQLGPEMLPPSVEKTEGVPADGLVVAAGTLKQPGFLRLIANAEIDGRKYRGLATAAFSPEQIKPTVEEPADFDAFWSAGKDALAKLPLDLRLTPLPDLSTGSVDVYHVNVQNVAADASGSLTGTSRLYGILAEPKADGRYPAVMNPPGAGVRGYRGLIDLAEKGIITLQIGIHGIPVTMDAPVYDALRFGALAGYPVFNLDNRERYYYRRVYLGCVRANDVLASRAKWDGKNLAVTGGSQGGALTIVSAALDPRVKAVAAVFPALSDTTGYVHGRAGGWPHMFRNEKDGHRTEAKLKTIAYYDVVNFARRVRVPGLYTWGYNDETCPPTSMYAAYGVIPGQKRLLLALETGHNQTPEQQEKVNRWLEAFFRNGSAE